MYLNKLKEMSIRVDKKISENSCYNCLNNSIIEGNYLMWQCYLIWLFESSN